MSKKSIDDMKQSYDIIGEQEIFNFDLECDENVLPE